MLNVEAKGTLKCGRNEHRCQVAAPRLGVRKIMG